MKAPKPSSIVHSPQARNKSEAVRYCESPSPRGVTPKDASIDSTSVMLWAAAALRTWVIKMTEGKTISRALRSRRMLEDIIAQPARRTAASKREIFFIEFFRVGRRKFRIRPRAASARIIQRDGENARERIETLPAFAETGDSHRIPAFAEKGFDNIAGRTMTDSNLSSFSLFHFEAGAPSFEDFGRDNGERFWLSETLMDALGYESEKPFQNAMNRAMTACANVGIDPLDHFRREEIVDENGGVVKTTRLSRFACYLTAMNADPKKPQVARAQMYFATLAESVREYAEEAGQVNRVVLRGEVSAKEKSLGATAQARGIEDYALFHNAGYRGLYNLNLNELKRRKAGGDLIRGSLLDYMGKTELAANLFRITQTEEKIRRENIAGQRNLETAHKSVGRRVRKAMIDISNTKPEDLPLEPRIGEAKKAIKLAHRKLKRISSGGD